jgi:hypothetical protein
MWTQGFSDGYSNEWSDRLANRNGPLGTLYVAGWLAGQKTTGCSSEDSASDKRLQPGLTDLIYPFFSDVAVS